MALPNPIGLHSDVMAGLARLLQRLCATLERLQLELRRVDRAIETVEIGLARAMRDAHRIAVLFAPKVESVDAGFDIDALRLVVTVAEPLNPAQIGGPPSQQDAMADLISRLGTA